MYYVNIAVQTERPMIEASQVSTDWLKSRIIQSDEIDRRLQNSLNVIISCLFERTQEFGFSHREVCLSNRTEVPNYWNLRKT